MKILVSTTGLVYGFIIGRIKTKNLWKSMLGGVMIAFGIIAFYDISFE